MPVLNADQSSQLLYAGTGSYLVANTDPANAVYLSQARTVSASDADLPPQASVTLTGTWYVSTLTRTYTVEVVVLPGGDSWSDPVGVQIALSALGLAKDSSVQTVATHTGNALSVGVPPNVPNIASAAAVLDSETSSPYTIYTFTGNGRLWGVTLSGSVASNSSYSPATTNFYMQVLSGTTTLEILELQLSAASQVDSQHGDLNLYGLPVMSGTVLYLDVNNGHSVSDVGIRASCSVLYSIP